MCICACGARYTHQLVFVALVDEEEEHDKGPDVHGVEREHRQEKEENGDRVAEDLPLAAVRRVDRVEELGA